MKKVQCEKFFSQCQGRQPPWTHQIWFKDQFRPFKPIASMSQGQLPTLKQVTRQYLRSLPITTDTVYMNNTVKFMTCWSEDLHKTLTVQKGVRTKTHNHNTDTDYFERSWKLLGKISVQTGNNRRVGGEMMIDCKFTSSAICGWGFEFIKSFITSLFYIQYFLSFYFSWSIPDNWQ